WWIAQNVIANLTRLRIASGFGFLNSRAGFDISESAIAYSSDSTYGRAILVGFLNTVIVAVAGIITATLIGFI
ncbi:MAG: amino acid ABC transporter permease, partial [Mesorhizobium sp.]